MPILVDTKKTGGLLVDEDLTQSAGPVVPSTVEVPDGSSKINWNFILKVEGNTLIGKHPTADSGVTIGRGFDLSGKNVKWLREMGVDAPLIKKLKPFFGLTGDEAKKAAPSLVLTEAERDHLNYVSRAWYSKDIARQYDSNAHGKTFKDLTAAQQTVFFSVLSQYGRADKVPNFFRSAIKGEWEEVQNELRNFGDAHTTRRFDEAALLAGDFTRDKELILKAALSKDPDQVAKDRVLAKIAGVSQALVEASRETVEESVKIQTVSSLLINSPVTSQHFSEDPERLAVAHDDIENLSIFENTANAMSREIGRVALGIAERTSSLIGAGIRIADTTADAASDVLEQLIPIGQIEFDFSGDTAKVVWRKSKQVDIDREGPLLDIARSFEGLDLGYKPGTTWEEFKTNPFVNFLPFALEQGIISIADMALVIANLPAYILIRSGEIGQTRAIHDKRTDATIEDFVLAAPAAIASGILERIGAKGILGINDALRFGGLKEIGKASLKGAGKEGVTEFGQEFAESVGETLGTKKGFDLAETVERGLQGLVTGLGFGGTVRAGTAAAESMALRKVRVVKKAMDKLNKISKESKYKKRDPVEANKLQVEILRKAGLDRVFIPVDKIIEMAKTNEAGEAALISQLEVADQLAPALEKQEDAKEDVLELTERDIAPPPTGFPTPITTLAEEPVIDLLEEQIVEPGMVGITLDAFVEHILGTNKYDAVSEAVVYSVLRAKTEEDIAAIFEPDLIKAISPLPPKRKVKVAKVLKKLKIKTTKVGIQTLMRGFRAGIKTALTNVKAAQSSIIDLINKSGLDAKDKAKFLKTIKNIQTPTQMATQLPIIQRRIVNLLEKARRGEIKKAIKTLLKKTKAPTKGEGKFDPDTQRVLDIARNIMSSTLSNKDAKAQLEANLENPTPGPDVEFENNLLAIKIDSREINSNDMEEMLVDLNAVRNEGKRAASIRKFKKGIRIASIVLEAEAAVTQGKEVFEIDTTSLIGKVREKFKETRTQLGALHNAWEELMDINFNKEGVDAAGLIEALDMTAHSQEVKAVIQKWSAEMERLGMVAYKVETQAQVRDELYASAVRENLGKFIDKNGRTVLLQYRRDEARKLWMELQDPTIRDAIFDENGNAYTPEMVVAILNIMTEGDIDYAKAQLAFYRKTYQDVNEVYRRMYGVNLPFNEFYSPIRRDKGAVPLDLPEVVIGQDTVLIEEMKYRRLIPSAIKKRKANPFAIEKRSDVGAMQGWQHDMSHFIATGEQSLFLHNVFSNATLRKGISAFHSKAMVEQIDGMVKDFNTGYKQRGRVAEAVFNRFNRVFARSVLAFKGTIGTKQLVSYFAMAEKVPVADFTVNSARFMKNPKKWIKILYGSSALMQTRGSSQDFELSKIGANDDVLLRLRQHQNIDDFLMAFIRYGDRAPIYMGGAARYMYMTEKKGLSHEEAIKDFEQITAATQQSTDIDRMSDLQRGGAIGRTFTLFMTARLSLLRGEMRAIRQFKRGKITAREFGKRMAIYHFIIPSLIQAIASGMRFEKEEQIRALLLGQLNGFIIFGDLLFWAMTEIMVTDNHKWSNDLPIIETLEDAWRGAGDAIEATSMEELMSAVGEVSDAAGVMIGEPVEQIRHIFIGGYKIFEGKVEEGAKLMWGFSPSVAEESSKER